METDTMLYNYRQLVRALRNTRLSEDCACAVASQISQRIDKNTITEADLAAIDLVESITGTVTKDAAFTITTSIINGIDNIKSSYDYLLSLGYSEDDVKAYFQKNTGAFSLKKSDIEQTYQHLMAIGLSDVEINNIYLHALLLNPEEVKSRCELVLKYYDKELLMLLAEGFLFHGYYSDPVGAIETAYTTLGCDLSRQLLENEKYFLYQFKLDFYRNNFTLPMPHKEAVEILEKYKSQLK